MIIDCAMIAGRDEGVEAGWCPALHRVRPGGQSLARTNRGGETAGSSGTETTLIASPRLSASRSKSM